MTFAVREIAHALVRVGNGDSYRKIATALREQIDRKRRANRLHLRKPFDKKGRPRQRPRPAEISEEPNLAMGYVDIFAPVVINALDPGPWPRVVALDALIVKSRSGSRYRAPQLRKKRRKMFPASSRKPVRRVAKKRNRIKIVEIGRALAAVGYKNTSLKGEAWQLGWAGGGDEESWKEFLRRRPGEPAWAICDRDGAIINAVREVWPNAQIYFSHWHLAKNAKQAAALDGLRHDEQFIGRLDYIASSDRAWAYAWDHAWKVGATNLIGWMRDNQDVVLGQLARRPAGLPMSAGAAEGLIVAAKQAITDRRHFFRNADRVDRMLALVRLAEANKASDHRYSRILRDHLRAHDGRTLADWKAELDRGNVSSLHLLRQEALARSKRAQRVRHGPAKALLYRENRAAADRERAALGLAPAPRGRPKLMRQSVGSVAGKTLADFGWLVVEWHPTRNGDLRPRDKPAGSGDKAWWKCANGPDHEWPAQIRSRTIRGVRCPFCTHRLIAPSESLAVTHPEIAVEWHPIKNRAKTPADFTYGSHHEAWWQCPAYKTHVYRARISSRTSMRSGCPRCARKHGKGGRPKAA